MSPASPENAIKVCWFNALVLSSDALRMVAPLIAALDAAMRVKSLPVIPSKTSLKCHLNQYTAENHNRKLSYMLIVVCLLKLSCGKFDLVIF